MAHADEYTLVEDVRAPGEAGSTHHLVDYQTQELVSTLWSRYLAENRRGLDTGTLQPAMRRVTYALDNEARPGDELQRGIKALSRTRRGFTCEAALWHKADGRVVHRAEIVTVWVEPGTGAVEIPGPFWENVERTEGRTIPVVERS